MPSDLAHEDLDNHYITIWDMATRRPLPHSLTGHLKIITSVRFSPDSQLLVSASDDNTLKLWRRADDDWRLLTTLHGHEGPVLSADFSPDGRMLVSSGADKTIRLWHIPMLETFADIQSNSASLSPDGKTVAASGSTASGENVTQLCHQDKTPYRLLCRPPQAHDFHVNALSFSPDGKILASGNEDNTIQLWNSSDGAPLMTLKGRGDITMWSIASASIPAARFSLPAVMTKRSGYGRATTVPRSVPRCKDIKMGSAMSRLVLMGQF